MMIKGRTKLAHVEGMLISSILRENDYETAIKVGVTSEQFHVFKAEWVWLEKFKTKFRKQPTKAAFRHQFPDFSIKAVNDTAHFATEVKKSHANSEMVKQLHITTDHLGEGDLDAAVRSMQNSIISIAAGMGQEIKDSDILRNTADAYDAVNERVLRVEKYGSAGIPTGFKTIDNVIGGAMPSYLHIVGARLGNRKSWILTQMACAGALAGYDVLYLSLEQPRDEISLRMHSLLAGSVGTDKFDSRQLNQGKGVNLRSYKAFLQRLDKDVKGKLHVVDSSAGQMSVHDIAMHVARHPVNLLLVDYLTLVKAGGEGDWKSVGNVAKDLKQIASENKIAVVSAAQLNREFGISGGKSDDPAGPEALAESDGIGHAADVIITAKNLSRSVSALKIAKHRHGTTGPSRFYCEFNPSIGVFKEVSKQRAEDLKDQDADYEDAQDHNHESSGGEPTPVHKDAKVPSARIVKRKISRAE